MVSGGFMSALVSRDAMQLQDVTVLCDDIVYFNGITIVFDNFNLKRVSKNHKKKEKAGQGGGPCGCKGGGDGLRKTMVNGGGRGM